MVHTFDVLVFVRNNYFVAVLQHPGNALIHHVQRSVALLVADAAHLQKDVLAAGRHRGRAKWAESVLIVVMGIPVKLLGEKNVCGRRSRLTAKQLQIETMTK